MLALAVALFLLQTDFYSEGIKALEEGKYESAVAAFQKAVAGDAKDYTAHFNLALAYGFLNRDVEGIAAYRKALELKPGLYEAELNAGILLMRTSQPAEALPLFEHAASQKPSEFRPQYYLGRAHLETGAYAKAETAYRRALELDPKFAEAALGLAHSLAAQNKLAESVPHFRQAAGLDPELRPFLLELAQLHEKAGQRAEAMAIYREFPDNPAAQEHLGNLLLEDRQYADAIPRLEAAYGKEPTNANRAALAAAYLFNKQLEEATPLLEAAVAAEPSSYELRMMYARGLRDRKLYPAAAAQFQEAAKLKPAEPKTWNELGGMLYLTGALEQSLDAFDRAQALGDSTPGLSFMRAIILDKLRQAKPAVEAYKRFLELSKGALPDQEFQARQRVRILEKEAERR